jgi:Tfp pilus assembly protein PilE
MIVVAIIGILAAVAIPAFMNYLAKSKGSEASLNLNKIAKATKIYWGEHTAFPASTSATLPGADGAACTTTQLDVNGKKVDNKMWVNASAWAADSTWAALDFSVDEPGLFTYHFASTATDATATAVGDLDCTGAKGTWTLNIKNDGGNIQTTITPPPAGSK